MTQQTPIDWLVEQLKSQHNIDIERLAVTDEANGMHKEQIMKAFALGKAEVLMYEIGNRKDGEDYYNETYEKK